MRQQPAIGTAITIKKRRIASPPTDRFSEMPPLPAVVGVAPAVSTSPTDATELYQIALANTRNAIEDQFVEMRSEYNEKLQVIQSELFAQITDLQQQLKRVAKKTMKWCVVCFERENDYAFIPCGHKCMCKTCAILTQQKHPNCPYCRVKITSIQRIYDANALDNQ